MKLLLKTLLVVGALALAFVAGQHFFGADEPWRNLEAKTHLLLDAGDFAAAEKMAQRMVRAAKKSMGAESAPAAQALSLLAYAQAEQGKHTESLKANLRAAEILEKLEGNFPSHLLLHTWESVAMERIALGQSAEVLPLLRRVLAGRERSRDSDRADLQRVLLNLAAQEFFAGNARAAENLALRALSLAEETETGRGAAAQQLGLIYQEQGNFSAAEENLQDALRAYAQEAGAGSWEAGYVLQLLARGKMDQGEFSTAATLLQRAKEIAENAGEEKAREMACVMTRLAELALWQEDFSQAEQNVAEARRWLGAISQGAEFDRGSLLAQEFALRIARDDLAAAKKTLEEMQSLQIKSADEFLHQCLLSADLLFRQGKYAESAQRYQQAAQQLAVQKNASPWNRLAMANGLGWTRLEQGDFSQAEENFRQALAVAEEVLKSASRRADGREAQLPAMLTPLLGLAESLLEQGKLPEAEEICGRTEKLAAIVWGEDSLARAEARLTQALLQRKRDENVAAESTVRQALVTYEKRLGEKHSGTAFALFRLAEIQLAQRNFSAAEETAEKARGVQEKIFGAKHPDAVKTKVLLERIRAEKSGLSSQS